MSQSGYTPILLYASGTATNVPLAANMTSSASGAELALNYADGKLYYKNSSGVVTLLASTAGASGDVVGPASATDNALVRFDATTGKLIQNSVGILSDTGALSGLTDISASGSVTLSGGTANGVAYLNGSKVLTTGTALVFDGSNLGLGVTPSAWGGSYKSIDWAGGAVAAFSNSQFSVWQNSYDSGAGAYKYVNTAAASRYQQVSGQHIWYNAPSGTAGNTITFTQAMTLDASGNLGIGTTSPAVKLQVNGNIRIPQNTFIQTEDGSGGWVELIKSDGSNNTTINNNKTGVIIFNNSNVAERARIDSSGNLLVGDTATAAGERLRVVGSVGNHLSRFVNTKGSTLLYGPQIAYSAISPNDTGNEFITCVDSTATRMTVRSNGGIANYSANNVNLSDSREKTNASPAGNYLDKICAIPVRTYNYIDQNLEEDDGLTLGVYAQDVQAVAPELVTESNWAKEGDEPKMRLSIYQTDMQYALMKALQELNAKFEAYKATHP
jgi:hypothetical protein